MSETTGLSHLGLSVDDLEASKLFFIEVLGWQESGYDPSYPRTAVSDGTLRLTLWQVDKSLGGAEFDRKKNVGLHHLAIKVESEAKLDELYRKIADHPKCTIEFAPELLSGGPRKHMMFNEPSWLRMELIWQGS
ncbi:VOC family protein [Veronia pacifica]|uniref:Glyoxalase n=1 Tax=Veronia pacifica TaxID=1080227 RepID=A0A1C3EMA7_9GAMM|nr:VOC family protein [Veronia pacifica]ODA34362.1 glyoxalase [Veronia pacifica]